jgi:hypothetical protein
MRLRLPAAVLAMAILALPASAAASTRVIDHLTAGQQLKEGLDKTPWPGQDAINTYDADDTDTHVTWGTVGVAGGWENDTRCARLVDELLTHAYPSWATSTWFDSQFDSTTPDTAHWAAKFVGSTSPTHIDEVGTVAALLPGDIVLIDRAAGTKPDHTAVVQEVKALPTGKTPVAGTVQYAVQVVDSTSEPHGAEINGTTGANKDWADSRRVDNADGTVTEYSGAGYGWMVLYANTLDSGKVYGWRWGVNESALNKISDGHRIVFARVTEEV